MCYSRQWICHLKASIIDVKERVIFTPKKGTNIYKRKDGRWEARYLKSIDKDGKRTYGSVYGKTFDEAKNKQDEILRNQSISSTVQAGVISNLLETSTEWMVSIQKSVKESTYLKYETIIRKHIRSHKIATTDMMKLTTKDIHNYSERLCAEGLSAKTVNDILVVLGLVLSYAEELYGITKPIRFAPAGRSRQLSVKSGISLVETDDVIIHEAARPFVKVEDFERLIAVKNRNVMLGTSIPFTVIKGHKTVEGVLNRSELVNVQLPQKFDTALLKASLEKATTEGREFTEDASMVFSYNPSVNIDICEGMDYNIKLTTRMDMLIGEKIYDDYFRMRE